MDREEFEERVMKGDQLMILDDLVLDVTHFYEFHPGGKWLIEHNIGRDISKFFYGGYKLDNKVNSIGWAHTNYARKMVNSMIIARLTKNGAKTQAQNIVSDPSKAQLNSKTSVFTFKSQKNTALKSV
jgi:cytochrome b involved in lipid metabolism